MQKGSITVLYRSGTSEDLVAPEVTDVDVGRRSVGLQTSGCKGRTVSHEPLACTLSVLFLAETYMHFCAVSLLQRFNPLPQPGWPCGG